MTNSGQSSEGSRNTAMAAVVTDTADYVPRHKRNACVKPAAANHRKAGGLSRSDVKLSVIRFPTLRDRFPGERRQGNSHDHPFREARKP